MGELALVVGVAFILIGIVGIAHIGFSCGAWSRRPSKPPVPIDREPKYKVTCVDGFWIVFTYREDCDLFAEPFVGDVWAWWQWKQPFDTEEQARQMGERLLKEARAKMAKDKARAQLLSEGI